jgi:phenylalanyl-tRNA synthetase beta chain
MPVTDIAELNRDDLPEIPISIASPAQCARYSGLRMKSPRATLAPLWMQIRLSRVGMRPINLLVDLTNYVMADLGQPMHAFDAKTVDQIEVAPAASGEKFKTLDGVERTMPDGTLMIQCRGRSIAIAGVMGGAETEISDGTTEMLLESANFEAATIRRAATAMGHRTDASARFEKSLDPNNTILAIQRFAHLATGIEKSLTLTSRLSDCYAAHLSIPTISIDPAHVERMVGQPTPRERIVSILRPLGFDVRDDGDRLKVTPPSFRATKDVSIEADLIEEVARSIGYDHIEPALPSVTAWPIPAAADRVVERRTLELLCRGGPFIEVHGYTWDDDDWLARLGFDPGASIRLKNPVAPNTARMRKSLMPHLLAVCEKNRWRMSAFRVAEVGTVFEAGHDEVTASQQRRLGLAVVRTGKKADAAVWAELKSHIETWADQVGRQPLAYAETQPKYPWEDDPACAAIRLGDRVVGRATLVPLALRLKIDDRLRTLSIGLAEITLTGLDPDGIQARSLPAPPAHPEAHVDFSFLADAGRRYAALAGDLQRFHAPLLRRLHFMDSFEGGSIPQGKRSFTIRAVVGDDSRTLTDDDLGTFRAAFAGYLGELGLEMRG